MLWRRVRSLSSIDQASSGVLGDIRVLKLGHQAHTRAKLLALAYMIGDNPEFELLVWSKVEQWK